MKISETTKEEQLGRKKIYEVEMDVKLELEKKDST